VHDLLHAALSFFVFFVFFFFERFIVGGMRGKTATKKGEDVSKNRTHTAKPINEPTNQSTNQPTNQPTNPSKNTPQHVKCTITLKKTINPHLNNLPPRQLYSYFLSFLLTSSSSPTNFLPIPPTSIQPPFFRFY